MITDKATMYRMLNQGCFGNTVPAFMSLKEWENRSDYYKSSVFPLWGIRSMKSGDKRMKLDVPTKDVSSYVHKWFGEDPCNISPMVDQWLTMRAEIFESTTGLTVRTVIGHNSVKWRDAFREFELTLSRIAAVMHLKSYLNSNSYDDLVDILDKYPQHVVELTALNVCRGTVHGRNAIIWEVREGTTGLYERNSGWNCNLQGTKK